MCLVTNADTPSRPEACSAAGGLHTRDPPPSVLTFRDCKLALRAWILDGVALDTYKIHLGAPGQPLRGLNGSLQQSIAKTCICPHGFLLLVYCSHLAV